jgi:hypothetical protein
MKRRVVLLSPIIVLLPIIVFFQIKALSVDRQLFYYGRNMYKHDLSLPFGITPVYCGYDRGMLGFTLLDNYETTWLAQGNSYVAKPGMKVDTVLSYGFNDNLLVGLIKATDQQKYYVIFGNTGAVEIQLYEKEGIDLSEKFKHLTWIDVRDKATICSKEEKRANYSAPVLLSLLLLLIIYIAVFFYKWIMKKSAMEINR